jgi:hypothetical protein
METKGLSLNTNYQELYSELIETWSKYHPSDLPKRVPLFPPELKINTLVFIGLNPSFNVPTLKKLTHDLIGETDMSYFAWNGGKDIQNKILTLIEIAKRAKKEYSTYYGVFNIIGRSLGLLNNEWEHIDLFSFRKTHQKTVKKVIKATTYAKMSIFAQRQLDMFQTLLRLSKPKIIVVNNAFGSKIYKDNFLRTQELSDYGWYWSQVGDRNIPTFLTGMLSGQRALDLFSRERLIWQLKKALKYMTEN